MYTHCCSCTCMYNIYIFPVLTNTLKKKEDQLSIVEALASRTKAKFLVAAPGCICFRGGRGWGCKDEEKEVEGDAKAGRVRD